jgi:hypothetical protein
MRTNDQSGTFHWFATPREAAQWDEIQAVAKSLPDVIVKTFRSPWTLTRGD